MAEVQASYLVDATFLSPDQPGSFVVSAVIAAPITGSFGVQASVPGWGNFTANAVITATVQNGYRPVWADTFDRTVAGSLGGDWTAGSAISGSGVDGSHGFASPGFNVNFYNPAVYALPLNEFDVLFDFRTQAVGAGSNLYVSWRLGSFYVSVDPAGSVTGSPHQYWLSLYNGGNAFQAEALTWYRIRARQTATAITARVWKVGDPEPETWLNTKVRDDATHYDRLYIYGAATTTTLVDNFEIWASAPIRVDAYIVPLRFPADAIRHKEQTGSVPVDALIVPLRFPADATILATMSGQPTPGGFRTNAAIVWHFEPTFAVEYQWGPGGSFTIGAVLLKTTEGIFGKPAIWSDDFNRTVAQGSGFGGTWTAGYVTYAGVDGDKGYVNSNYAYAYNATVDALVPNTFDATVEFLTPMVGGSGSFYFQFGFTRSYFYIQTNGAIADPSSYYVYLWCAGSAYGAYINLSPSTYYRARLQQGSGSVGIKFWKLTDTEPGSWALTGNRGSGSTTTQINLQSYGNPTRIDNVAIWPYGDWGYRVGFSANAVIVPWRFWTYATVFRNQEKTFPAAAVKRQTYPFVPGFTIDYQWGPGGSFTIAAVVLATVTGLTTYPYYWLDDFGRTANAAWGGTWTAGYLTYAGVDGSQGYVAANASAYAYANNPTIDALGLTTWDATIEFQTPPVGGSTSWRVQWQIPSTFFYVYPYATIASPTSAYRVYLIAKGLSVNITTLQLAPATWYRARMQQAVGTSYIRIWKVGDAEPGTWLLTRTQSTSTYSSYFQVQNYSTVAPARFDNMGIWQLGGWGTRVGFLLDAAIVYRHFHADASLLKLWEKTFTAAAVIKKPNNIGTPLTIDYQWGPGGSFTARAIRGQTIQGGSAQASILASSPAAYWPLSDATTTSATELVAGRTATPVTPANISSVSVDGIGRGWQWGAGSYLTSTFYQPATSEATIEAWVKTTCIGEIWQGRIGATGGGGGRGISLSFQGNTGGGFGGINGHIQFFINSDGLMYGVRSNVPYNDNVLHHIVGVFTGGGSLSPSQFKIYVDGAEIATTALGTAGSATPPYQGVTTGVRFLGANYGAYTGFAAHIAFYTRSLTPSEISLHYLRVGMILQATLRRNGDDFPPHTFPVEFEWRIVYFGDFSVNATILAHMGMFDIFQGTTPIIAAGETSGDRPGPVTNLTDGNDDTAFTFALAGYWSGGVGAAFWDFGVPISAVGWSFHSNPDNFYRGTAAAIETGTGTTPAGTWTRWGEVHGISEDSGIQYFSSISASRYWRFQVLDPGTWGSGYTRASLYVGGILPAQATIFRMDMPGSLTVGAVLLKPNNIGTPFTIDYGWGPGGSFTFDAIQLKTIDDSSSSWVGPGWVDPILFRKTAFVVSAWISGVFTLDATIFPLHFRVDARIGVWFPADAWIVPLHFFADAIRSQGFTSSFPVAAIRGKTIEGTFSARAVIKKTIIFEPGLTLEYQWGPGGSITFNAAIIRNITGSTTLRAIQKWTVAGTTTAEAWLAGRFFVNAYIAQWFTARAVIFRPGELIDPPLTFTVEAEKCLEFHVNAFIQPYFHVDADIQYGFVVEALIKRTIGVPTMMPLVFPGSNQQIYGNVANVITPAFPVEDYLVVNIVDPPSDGGYMGAWNASLSYNYVITKLPGEWFYTIFPGVYYLYSNKDNTYRPTLSGSGTYSNWGVSSLQFTVEAFIELRFTVDSALVWHWEFAAPTVDALVLGRITSSFKVEAIKQWFFRLDAKISYRHFLVDVWIQPEIHVDAWLIRRVLGHFHPDAFVQPYFRARAALKKTQAKPFTVNAFILNPIYGHFHVEGRIGWYFTVGSSIRLTKYRRFTAGAIIRRTYPSSVPVEGFVQPYFRVNAVLFRMEFFLYAVIIAPVDGAPKTIDSAFVWHWEVVGPTLDAYIEGYFRLRAIKLETFESSFAVDCAIVIRRTSPIDYPPMTVDAFLTGFFVNATIFKPGKPRLFNVYAMFGDWTRTGTFKLDAVRGDGSAYWDPIWEVWRYPAFTSDATIGRIDTRSIPTDAVITLEGLTQRHFNVNARLAGFGIEGEIWVEAFIESQHTVVFEGDGETSVVHHLVTERLSYPGIPSPIRGTDNTVSSGFYPPYLEPVSITLWEVPYSNHVGIYAKIEDKWTNIYAPGTVVFYPQREDDIHYVYTWTTGAYDPNLTGSGAVSYYRDDTIVASWPAPTIDAWIVGTPGEPWTINAEIIGREKLGSFIVSSDLVQAGEMRGSLGVDGYILGRRTLIFRVSAVIAQGTFTINSWFYVPPFTAEAGFPADAVILKAWASGINLWQYGINAVIWRSTVTRSFRVGAATAQLGERNGYATIDADILGPVRPRRFYLAAEVAGNYLGFSAGAYIAPTFKLDAFIATYFRVSAFIRGTSYIIFPEDGGPPTDPLGNEPNFSRSFRVKIEAGIPEPVPIGNDAEIERLIALILEAEQELDAMYCAVVHYKPQDQTTTTQWNSNPSGTGYNRGSLPGALSQIPPPGYPGAGDIDDCWVVATVWAAIAAGETYKPSVPVFRSLAGNPDRPGPTGGSGYHVWKGSVGAWPNHKIRKYTSSNWDGFISLLKAGWIASLGIRLSGLPSSHRYGYKDGLHQIGVAYQNGTYYYMDPNQPNGSAPRAVSGYELRTAARGFSGGTISATMFA